MFCLIVHDCLFSSIPSHPHTYARVQVRIPVSLFLSLSLHLCWCACMQVSFSSTLPDLSLTLLVHLVLIILKVVFVPTCRWSRFWEVPLGALWEEGNRRKEEVCMLSAAMKVREPMPKQGSPRVRFCERERCDCVRLFL